MEVKQEYDKLLFYYEWEEVAKISMDYKYVTKISEFNLSNGKTILNQITPKLEYYRLWDILNRKILEEILKNYFDKKKDKSYKFW
jgi:hypothetical protein